MQKAKRNSKFILCGLMFVLVCMLCLTMIPTSAINASAATDVFVNSLTNVTMNVSAINKDRETVDATTKNVTISGGDINNKSTQAQSYKWSNVKYFKINMSGLNETNLGTKTPGTKYEYKYTVTYFPNVIDGEDLAYNNAAVLTKDFYSYNSETTEGINDEVYFFIDNNQSEYKTTGMDITANAETVFADSDVYTMQGGWGVYVFTFTCDDKETSGSFVYELLPTSLEELHTAGKNPTVSYEVVPSAYSINNAYLFYVNEDFQYVNREYITWSIKGTGSDGTKYTLFGDNDSEALYPEAGIRDKGATFKFDRNIQGKWEASVTISDGIHSFFDRSEEVSTIKPFSTTSIVIIVSCVTVVAVAIVAVIIIIRSNKEKTW